MTIGNLTDVLMSALNGGYGVAWLFWAGKMPVLLLQQQRS